jgi:hypothetical protein
MASSVFCQVTIAEVAPGTWLNNTEGDVIQCGNFNLDIAQSPKLFF